MTYEPSGQIQPTIKNVDGISLSSSFREKSKVSEQSTVDQWHHASHASRIITYETGKDTLAFYVMHAKAGLKA